MIFTRRFGALAARRNFNDRLEVDNRAEVTETQQTPSLSDAALQQQKNQLREDVAA
ncbi:MAG TPA: hypothetical protein VK053_20115 [Jiangellaceae bacterium]|nr:hypothetical protein [Jiangellaceae bacterium]